MTEVEKTICAKLDVLKSVATDKAVVELASLLMLYVKSNSKGKIGFENGK